VHGQASLTLRHRPLKRGYGIFLSFSQLLALSRLGAAVAAVLALAPVEPILAIAALELVPAVAAAEAALPFRPWRLAQPYQAVRHRQTASTAGNIEDDDKT
jgi:hypothetical protein